MEALLSWERESLREQERLGEQKVSRRIGSVRWSKTLLPRHGSFQADLLTLALLIASYGLIDTLAL